MQQNFFSMSTPSGCFCHAKIHLIPNLYANWIRRGTVRLYAASMQQKRRKYAATMQHTQIFFQIWSIWISFLLLLHLLTEFQTNWTKTTEVVVFAVHMKQKCCKNATKFFFNEHPFWLFLSCQNIPNPKLLCKLDKKENSKAVCCKYAAEKAEICSNYAAYSIFSNFY